MERKVGEVFKLRGKKYKVRDFNLKNQSNCDVCCFNQGDCFDFLKKRGACCDRLDKKIICYTEEEERNTADKIDEILVILGILALGFGTIWAIFNIFRFFFLLKDYLGIA